MPTPTILLPDGARGFGWKPELPDQRDHKLSNVVDLSATASVELPSHVDLREIYTGSVYDQGSLGSCTANAIAANYEFMLAKQGAPVFRPSRLAIYWAERVYEHSTRYDAGAYIRDGYKAIHKRGVNDEASWPYDISKFAKAPPRKFWNGARKHESLGYAQPDKTLDGLRTCLANGYPFVYGFTVYESFRRIAGDGFMPVPQPNESVLGGHAVFCVGYHDEQSYFIVRNSWGTDWGAGGYFYVPYEFMLSNNTDDFWTLYTVEG